MADKKDKKAKSSPVHELSVLSTAGTAVDKLVLDPEVFDGKVNHELMHQAVVAYLSNQRKGLANTKTRGEVSGGGRKPWKQKGTGRARAGSTRSPLWKGGGVLFGPKPHSFYKDLPHKMKALALKSALNAKLNDNEIMVLNELKLAAPKTKGLFAILKKLDLAGIKLMVVIEGSDNNLRLAARNLVGVNLKDARSFNTYEALSCKKIVFAGSALNSVQARIKQGLQ